LPFQHKRRASWDVELQPFFACRVFGSRQGVVDDAFVDEVETSKECFIGIQDCFIGAFFGEDAVIGKRPCAIEVEHEDQVATLIGQYLVVFLAPELLNRQDIKP